jgi:hypothetical protein
MSLPSEPVNLILLVYRRPPPTSSKPQIYVTSLRQYTRGTRLVTFEFAHHVCFPDVRVFLLVCFYICFDRAVPRYVG